MKNVEVRFELSHLARFTKHWRGDHLCSLWTKVTASDTLDTISNTHLLSQLFSTEIRISSYRLSMLGLALGIRG